ncbi:MAG TPA: hypothetical protein VK668_01305 [Mucilaginibacter sp.]|nr:hypothetical protein [Mucilaginibacter sp.]
MSYLLRLKHWQLFIILVCLPLISDLFVLISMLFYFAWVFAIGSTIHAKIAASHRPNNGLYLACFAVAVVLSCIILIPKTTLSYYSGGEYHYLSWLLLGVYFFSCVYLLYFSTKMLVTAMGGGDFPLWFLRFVFYFVGVWYIQPMVQGLYEEGGEMGVQE